MKSFLQVGKKLHVDVADGAGTIFSLSSSMMLPSFIPQQRNKEVIKHRYSKVMLSTGCCFTIVV